MPSASATTTGWVWGFFWAGKPMALGGPADGMGHERGVQARASLVSPTVSAASATSLWKLRCGASRSNATNPGPHPDEPVRLGTGFHQGLAQRRVWWHGARADGGLGEGPGHPRGSQRPHFDPRHGRAAANAPGYGVVGVSQPSLPAMQSGVNEAVAPVTEAERQVWVGRVQAFLSAAVQGQSMPRCAGLRCHRL
jgi:hypothetical protein